jgi:hypothetical protein
MPSPSSRRSAVRLPGLLLADAAEAKQNFQKDLGIAHKGRLMP